MLYLYSWYIFVSRFLYPKTALISLQQIFILIFNMCSFTKTMFELIVVVAIDEMLRLIAWRNVKLSWLTKCWVWLTDEMLSSVDWRNVELDYIQVYTNTLKCIRLGMYIPHLTVVSHNSCFTKAFVFMKSFLDDIYFKMFNSVNENTSAILWALRLSKWCSIYTLLQTRRESLR